MIEQLGQVLVASDMRPHDLSDHLLVRRAVEHVAIVPVGDAKRHRVVAGMRQAQGRRKLTGDHRQIMCEPGSDTARRVGQQRDHLQFGEAGCDAATLEFELARGHDDEL